MLERLFEILARSAARRSLPDPVPGVRFDRHAVPTVEADTEEQLFERQGYLHARERMWQMELARRTVAGRLSEVLGDPPIDWRDFNIHLRGATLVDVDFYMRVMGLREAAKGCLEVHDERTREALEAYARGVNAWLDSRPRRKLPVEFRLLHHVPEPWTALDSVSVIRGMALELNVSWKFHLLQQGVADSLPEELRTDLLPGEYGPADPAILELLALDAAAREFAGWRGQGLGSNSWALAGHRTASGRPLLANDPHLRMRSPGIWYLARLRAGDYDVAGATMPGVPGVIIGRNRHLAWGLTNAMLHDSDLVEEVVEGDCYREGDEWRPLQTRTEIIGKRARKVVFAPTAHAPTARTVRLTPRGPLLTDALCWGRALGAPKGRPNKPLAMRWIAHQPSAEIQALLGANRARSGREAREALRSFACPGQNVVYADDQGHIGYQLAGRIPGVPFEDLPHLEDPPEGFVATANNQIVEGVAGMWEPPFRIRRIREMIAERERHTADDVAAMQSDDLSLEARDFLAEVLDPEALAAAGLSALGARAADRLAGWDARCGVDSVPATIYHAWMDRLLHALLGRRLPEPLFWAWMEHINQAGTALRRLLRRPESPWWLPRGREAVMAETLDETVRILADRLGYDMDSWHWGRLHQAEFVHALGSRLRLFNQGPMPTPGSPATVNAGGFLHSRPFAHTVGAGYRQVVDFGGPSRFVSATGQSGNPVSPHYRDLTKLWLQGRYIPMEDPA